MDVLVLEGATAVASAVELMPRIKVDRKREGNGGMSISNTLNSEHTQDKKTKKTKNEI